ncbi:MAG TPA: hypothetical protein PKE31_21145 [Pseudomonadota bacterium]|nr:hypothetical protein [Pseudomonadota bacterium]HMU41527.1 hypothetical protein [Pseudomonadota bacterium]
MPRFEKQKDPSVSPWHNPPTSVLKNHVEPAPETAKPKGGGETKPGQGPQAKPPTDHERVEQSLNEAHKLLQGTEKEPVTPEKAKGALDSLRSLPPALQGQAVEKLSKDDFSKMLTTVTLKDRELFESLYKNTKDPEKKLLLWAEYHKSKTHNDAEKDKEAIDPKELADPSKMSAESKEKNRKNQRRDSIAATTDKEVDEERDILLEKIKRGEVVKPEEIDALAERKQLEHEIERKHLVNLTNDVTSAGNDGKDGKPKVAPTQRRTWSVKELTEVSSGLDRLPPEATRDNANLQEIRRSGVAERFNNSSGAWDQKPNIGGDHGGGVVRIYDTGVTGNYRHTGDTSDLADHRAGQQTPHGPVTPLEETIVHEIGHDIHDINPVAMKNFMAAAGWDNYSEAQLKASLLKSGKTEDEAKQIVAQLNAERGKHYSQRTGADVGGQHYMIDPYSGGFLSHTVGGVASGQTWGYAESNSKDHFAETYSKAVHVPEQLHNDLITQPKAECDRWSKQQGDAQKSLEQVRTLKEQGKATEADVKEAEKALKSAQEGLAKAEQSRTALEAQWRIMREDVFGMNQGVVADSAKVLEQQIPPGKEELGKQLKAEFELKAEAVMTPQQLEALKKEYEGKMQSL